MGRMIHPRRKPFQRHYADQASAYVKEIRAQHEALHEAIDAGDREAELHALGPLAEAYRMLGQLDAALPHAERALALARELDKPKFVVSNLIRLATTYQYLNRHEEAEPLFEEAVELSRRVGVLEDFALQHQGKCLAELGRWDEAIANFEAALAMRKAKGQAELIASSQEALDEARIRGGK
jgi:tetratricopeptide (TPR) repeat protein